MHLAKRKMTLPVIHDTKQSLFKLYGIKHLPHAVLLNKNGAIEWRGDTRGEEFEKALAGEK